MKDKSNHKISDRDIEWADLIMVMEGGYISWIQGLFRHLDLPPIVSLDIPDEYEYMDSELIELIQKGTEFHINQLLRKASRQES